MSNIKDNEGNKLEFHQEGDFIQVELKQPTQQITLEYSGVSSPFMDANRYFAYLPYYFAWIPLKSQYPSMKYIYNSNHRLPGQPAEPIDYVLHYQGENEVMTNLKKVGKGKYVGTNEQGITLIYGELKTKKIQDYDITYPITWENSIGTVHSYLEQLEQTFETVQTIFQLEKQKLPKNILFIPARGPNDTLPSETMWYQEGEQFTILIDPYEHHDETTFDFKAQLMTYQMVGALLWKNDRIVYQNEDISTVFNALVGTYVNKKVGVEELSFSEEDYWIGEILLKTSENDKKIIQDLSTFFSRKSEQEIERFLLEWRTLLQNPNVTWNQVDKLLKAYQ
ncbi:hypothetical protein EDD68_10279 [Melghiribacillus thermohalophilus]|uniref:Uncharacterized protein n=1 Tax=Melghiribacillus thermohalophilus TaxID=1324956 RepID=A0A4R3NC23_9BACI|nr:hypothetical protein [Melghiribacillus thermohalophilus]TCT26378.1 hypothetical protein EDD68_10279 [Melghiribacillus thermohalophilus]